MPRSKTKLEYNTFVKGLITEASPLTFPDGASLVDENFVLNKDGSRNRRLGLKYENDFVKKTLTSLHNTTTKVNSYTWKSVNGNGSLDIAVFQIGSLLYFYDNNVSPITGSPLNSGSALDLSIYSSPTDLVYSFSSVRGELVVATGGEEVIVVSYNATLDSVSSTPLRIEVRDLFGIEEIGVDPFVRRSAASHEHKYNLSNQGWPLLTTVSTDDIGTSVSTNIYAAGYAAGAIGVYPNNSDIFGSFKLSSATSIKAINSFSPWEMEKINTGTAQAPRGSIIIDVFNRGATRNLKTALTVPNDESVGGVRNVTSYAGRAFYSLNVTSENGTDENSPDLTAMVCFSKSTTKIDDLGECYSHNDPSAEDFNNPLDTDGGYIVLSGAGEIYALSPLGSSLFVIASRGVWEISGGESVFSATNQLVTKTTDAGAISGSSVVVGEAMISYMSSGGIKLYLFPSLTPAPHSASSFSCQA